MGDCVGRNGVLIDSTRTKIDKVITPNFPGYASTHKFNMLYNSKVAK